MSKRPMTRVGRAIERGETKGFIKILADADTRQILGAAVLGVSGDEVIHGILNMMNAKAPYPALQWAVPVHPTVSELIPTVINDLRPLKWLLAPEPLDMEASQSLMDEPPRLDLGNVSNRRSKHLPQYEHVRRHGTLVVVSEQHCHSAYLADSLRKARQ